MKPHEVLITAIVGAGLAFGAAAQAKEHEEENIDSSKVPAAVQQAAEKEAAGGKIVRWEKEGSAYEAVIEKDGKQWAIASMRTGR